MDQYHHSLPRALVDRWPRLGVERRQLVGSFLTDLFQLLTGVLTPPFFDNRICYWLTDEV